MRAFEKFSAVHLICIGCSSSCFEDRRACLPQHLINKWSRGTLGTSPFITCLRPKILKGPQDFSKALISFYVFVTLEKNCRGLYFLPPIETVFVCNLKWFARHHVIFTQRNLHLSWNHEAEPTYCAIAWRQPTKSHTACPHGWQASGSFLSIWNSEKKSWPKFDTFLLKSLNLQKYARRARVLSTEPSRDQVSFSVNVELIFLFILRRKI